MIDVFEEESKNNEQISEIYELYKQLPENIKVVLSKETFKPGKLNEEDSEDIYNSLENMVFSSKKLCKSHDKHKKKH